MHITTIGVDLAKTIFQVHGVTDEGKVAFNRSLRRNQVLPFFSKLDPCLIGMEACGTSHHWAREIDAEAICEAVTRPTMRFVPIKSPEQQALLSQHRARQMMIGQRTQLSNMIRGLIGEFGYIIRKGLNYIRDFAEALKAGDGPQLPHAAQMTIGSLCEQLLSLHGRIKNLETEIFTASRKDERVRLLETIPGIGPVTASAIAATVGSPEQFKSGREFAAWLGLTPLNRSSGGKERLGRISKMGDRYLRTLLVAGMTSRVRAARTRPERVEPWLASLLERKPVRLATVAMANKTARIVWAVLTRKEPYKHPVPA